MAGQTPSIWSRRPRRWGAATTPLRIAAGALAIGGATLLTDCTLPTPSATPHPLVDLLPLRVGSYALERSAETVLTFPQALADRLRVTPDAAEIASSHSSGPPQQDVIIAAFRIRGTPGADVLAAALPDANGYSSFLHLYLGGPKSTADPSSSIAGKQVIRIRRQDPRNPSTELSAWVDYPYAHEDVLFLVSLAAKDPKLTTLAFEALP